MKMNMKDVETAFRDYWKIAEHYGKQIELDKLKEECGELVDAIREHETMKTSGALEHMQEECADVLLCIAHIGYLTGGTTRILYHVRMKIERQFKRMSAEAREAVRRRIE